MDQKQKSRRVQRIEMVQILYQFELFNKILDLDFIFENYDITPWQNDIFKNVLKLYDRNKKIIEPILLEGRIWEGIPPLNRAIISLGSVEILSLDKGIVINEYVTISKEFSPDNSYKFINNILEKVSLFYEYAKKRNQRIQKETKTREEV